jgi:hypothetical protein
VVEGDNSTTEVETPTEGEISPPVETPDWDDVKETVSEDIVGWLFEHFEKVLVSIFLLASAIWEKRRDKRINKNVSTLNNNAVTIAKTSTDFMGSALSEMQTASGAVVRYEARIESVLEAFGQILEERAVLIEQRAMIERELVELKNYLQTSSQANIEFANVLAELLALANIPNYKKEEFGARHLAVVNALKEAETRAEAEADAAANMLLPATVEEVKEDDGEEA